MAQSLPREELARRRLMIGTPMYEGLCHGAYTAALLGIAQRLRDLGVVLRVSFIVNQSSPERARAMILDTFLRSDCTHLCFIDADVAVTPEDVVGLLALQGDDTPYDVIGGTCPRKAIDWEAVAAAARAGVPASELVRHGGDMCVNLLAETREIRLAEPLEAMAVGGGYCMIRRATFQRLIAAYPELAYAPDPRERAGHGLGETLYAFYSPAIDPATQLFRSEDFSFCDRVRRAGMRVWLCPWMHADHIGNHRFSGTFADAVRRQASLPPVA